MLEFADDRYAAYCTTSRQAGLKPEHVGLEFDYLHNPNPSSYITERACRDLERYFDKHGFPDALCCSNDDIAIGAYRALRKTGRQIPQQGFTLIELLVVIAPINSYGLITAVSLAEIQTPSETVTMTDNAAAPPYTAQDWIYPARFWRINGGGTVYANSDVPSVAYQYGDGAPRHLETVNVLWLMVISKRKKSIRSKARRMRQCCGV